MKLFIGDIIQKLRKIKGLTQEQVTYALGITTSSVSKWETNNTYPDISLLSPLARLLGTAVDIKAHSMVVNWCICSLENADRYCVLADNQIFIVFLS